jgi:hypothetical protein
MTDKPRPIAIYHEHPDWFRPQLEEMERFSHVVIRRDANGYSFRNAIMGSTLVARRAGT